MSIPAHRPLTPRQLLLATRKSKDGLGLHVASRCCTAPHLPTPFLRDTDELFCVP
jgi:hypothetical protein